MMLFGRSWGAPVCEDAEWLPETPTYARCTRCHHLFQPADQGYVLPTFGEVDPDYLIGLTGPDSAGQAGTLTGIHRECQLLGTVGHVFSSASAPAPDGTRRAGKPGSNSCAASRARSCPPSGRPPRTRRPQ